MYTNSLIENEMIELIVTYIKQNIIIQELKYRNYVILMNT